MSFKITKGLYYRTSAFKGKPVQTELQKHIGIGSLYLTDKNLYFYSPNKTIKIPYKNILSLQQYEDGIEIQRDGNSSKPQLYKNVDGWFTYNLISNLVQQ